jgi:putative endonuclease
MIIVILFNSSTLENLATTSYPLRQASGTNPRGNNIPRSAPPAGGGSSARSMYTVYAIYNSLHKKIYIGQTKDLENRLNLHAASAFKNSFTARFSGDWVVIYKEQTQDRKAALFREKQLKSYRGREFVKKHIPR